MIEKQEAPVLDLPEPLRLKWTPVSTTFRFREFILLFRVITFCALIVCGILLVMATSWEECLKSALLAGGAIVFLVVTRGWQGPRREQAAGWVECSETGLALQCAKGHDFVAWEAITGVTVLVCERQKEQRYWAVRLEADGEDGKIFSHDIRLSHLERGGRAMLAALEAKLDPLYSEAATDYEAGKAFKPGLGVKEVRLLPEGLQVDRRWKHVVTIPWATIRRVTFEPHMGTLGAGIRLEHEKGREDFPGLGGDLHLLLYLLRRHPEVGHLVQPLLFDPRQVEYERVSSMDPDLMIRMAAYGFACLIGCFLPVVAIMAWFRGDAAWWRLVLAFGIGGGVVAWSWLKLRQVRRQDAPRRQRRYELARQLEDAVQEIEHPEAAPIGHGCRVENMPVGPFGKTFGAGAVLLEWVQLLPLLGAAIVFVVFMIELGDRSETTEIADFLFLFLVVGGAILLTLLMGALGRFIKKFRLVGNLRSRLDRCVDPDDPEACYIEVVPRAHWTKLMLETAADVGFLKVDAAGRQVLFEGERQRIRIGAGSLVSCDIEEVTGLCPRYLVIRTRWDDGTILEVPVISRRHYRSRKGKAILERLQESMNRHMLA